MNERIRELIDECTEWITGTIDGDVECFDKEKFARLIVRECMLCCERVISDPVPKSVDIWLNGGKQCIDEIKYHFGVEE